MGLLDQFRNFGGGDIVAPNPRSSASPIFTCIDGNRKALMAALMKLPDQIKLKNFR